MYEPRRENLQIFSAKSSRGFFNREIKFNREMEGDYLLLQLEKILENDDQIDEIGFIHPTQFESLDSYSDSNHSQSNSKYFWSKDHKLAISSEILPSLYKSAIKAHSNARNRFNISANSPRKENHSFIDEIDLLKHSKALVILSPNFPTAWNSRKLILSKENDVIIYINELRLSNLILSYSPKSESAWTHRRWVIKFFADKFCNIEETISNESELVKKICEKFKMNYRAWNHQCWVVSYMPKQQVLEELKNSRKWAELHISDNSCFHFRTCLLLKIMEISNDCDVRLLWEDELKWNELLITRYIGREALWVHRRFLSCCYINRFLSSQTPNSNLENQLENNNLNLELFLDQEVKLARNCLSASPDEFEDTEVQSRLAISYLLWISKKVPVIGSQIRERLREVTDVTSLLVKLCPEKATFWTSI